MIDEWNYSRIDTANYCKMRFFLRYILHEYPIRLSAYVKGSFLHTIIENFWDELGTDEEVQKDKKSRKKAAEKKNFFDANSFSDYSLGIWKRIINADLAMKRKASELEQTANSDPRSQRALEKMKSEVIQWRDNSEKYYIQGMLPKLCHPLYHKLFEEGKPEFSELKFDFMLDRRYFNGRIDVVRLAVEDGIKKVVIRDYKSGSSYIGHMKVDFDPQLTFYNMGLSSLCIKSSDFAERLGIGNLRGKMIENLENEGILICEDIEEEFFMIESLTKIEEAKQEILKPAIKKEDFAREEDYIFAKKRRERIKKNIPSLTFRTKRIKRHQQELIEMIEATEKAVLLHSEDIVAETGRKCDSCDMKIACEKRILEKSKGIRHSNYYGQQFFSFASPEDIALSERKRFSASYKQKKMSFKKK